MWGSNFSLELFVWLVGHCTLDPMWVYTVSGHGPRMWTWFPTRAVMRLHPFDVVRSNLWKKKKKNIREHLSFSLTWSCLLSMRVRANGKPFWINRPWCQWACIGMFLEPNVQYSSLFTHTHLEEICIGWMVKKDNMLLQLFTRLALSENIFCWGTVKVTSDLGVLSIAMTFIIKIVLLRV